MMILADLLETISSLVTSIMGKIGDIFLRYFFSIFVRPLFKLMDTFIDIMLMLAGINPLDSSASDDNLITTFLQSKSVSNLYMYVAIFSAVLLMVLAIYEIIKKDFFSEKAEDSHAKVIRKVITGMIYIIAIPPIFLFAVSVVAQVFELLWNIDGVNQLSALSQAIFELCLNKPEWMVRAELLNEVSQPLAPIPHWSVITSEQLATLTSIYDFNFVIFLGVLGIAFYSIFMLAFAFAKRIFRLVLLYVIGPIAVAQSVNSDDKFNQWKKDVIKELISIFGTLISLVIFMIFCTEVNNITFLKDQVSVANTSTIALFNMVIKALFMLVGFAIIRDGDKILETVVGGNISVRDGEKAWKEVKESVSNATAPYSAVANTAKGVVGAAKGAYEGAFNLAAGAVKGARALKRGGISGLLEEAGEKQRAKWHDATRLSGEETYEQKRTREREALEGIRQHSTPVGSSPQEIYNGLNSNNRGEFMGTVQTVRDHKFHEHMDTPVNNFAGMSGTGQHSDGITDLNNTLGTSLNVGDTAAQIAQAVSNALSGADMSHLNTMEIAIETAISDATRSMQAAQATARANPTDANAQREAQAAAARVQMLKETKTTIVTEKEVRTVQTQFDDARRNRSREDMAAAQKAAVDLAKKESN